MEIFLRHNYPQLASKNADLPKCGKRIGPESLTFPENPEKELLFVDKEKDTFIWAPMRQYSLPRKYFPSWTGFNDRVPVMKSSVQYLNCIDNPATQKSTIYQVGYGLFICIQVS